MSAASPAGGVVAVSSCPLMLIVTSRSGRRARTILRIVYPEAPEDAAALEGEAALNGAAGLISKMSGVRKMGLAGEAAVDFPHNNTRIVSLTGTASYRIPDGLTSTVLSEVKNVSKLNLTNQIRDFTAYSNAKNLEFNLYVRESTQISGPLQSFIEDHGINLVRSLSDAN